MIHLTRLLFYILNLLELIIWLSFA